MKEFALFWWIVVAIGIGVAICRDERPHSLTDWGVIIVMCSLWPLVLCWIVAGIAISTIRDNRRPF